MKFSSSRSTPEMQITPPPGTGQGVRGWFAAFQKPILDKHLATKVAIVFAAISIGQTVAIVRISDNSGPKRCLSSLLDRLNPPLGVHALARRLPHAVHVRCPCGQE